ncbi:MAG: VanW family protein [Clostridia bacterium]|nr:VanW family protein [Clostridia bacterium]
MTDRKQNLPDPTRDEKGIRYYGYGVESGQRPRDSARRTRLMEAAEQARQQEKKHGLLWAVVAVLALWCIGGLALFAAPQLFGVRYESLPNWFFTGGGVITLDSERFENYRASRLSLETDAIYPGVLIDGVDVGGMTVSQARQALENVSAGGGGTFSVTVKAGRQKWSLTSNDIPMSRNLDEALAQAWAAGRQNSPLLRQSGLTPFEERLMSVQKLEREGLSLVTSLTWDREALRARCQEIADSVTYDPVDASVLAFDFNTHQFTFTQDSSGQRLNGDAVYQAVTARLEAGDVEASLSFEPETVPPAVTRAQLASSFGRISSFTTSTTKDNNRNTNVRLSAEAIHGTVVQPGETFSFNQTTGQRTAEKGYKEATAIQGGQNIAEVGGGVCQTSSTLFNAVARANLEIVYRSPHAWPSKYVEKGMDATVNWPGLDFKWRNNSDWPVYIVAWYENRKVTVALYGCTLGEGVTIDLESEVVRNLPKPSGINYVYNPELRVGERKTTVQARAGYVVDTYQVWYRNGQMFKREKLCTSTYKAYQETIEYNDGPGPGT